MKHTFLISTTSLLCLVCMLASCSKNGAVQQQANATILDSIYYGNDDYNMAFKYDAQNRVIETRLTAYDTLRQVTTYEYNGNDPSPFKKLFRESQFATYDYDSYFEYDTNGNKVSDSSVSASGGSGYFVVKLDYSIPNRICVFQGTIYNHADTVYLNNNGNIDSVRHYHNYSPPGSLTYWATSSYSNYNTKPNIFKSLSIAKASFYSPDAGLGNIGQEILGVRTYNFPFIFDFYNTNYFTVITNSTTSYPTPWDQTRQLQFNSIDLPVTQTISIAGYEDIRFVYR